MTSLELLSLLYIHFDLNNLSDLSTLDEKLTVKLYIYEFLIVITLFDYILSIS